MKKLLTPDEVRERFEREGITIKDWAEENGFKPYAVQRVVSGISRCKRGEGHEIAVALGMKDGVSRKDRRAA